mmetsp:Transcript_32890/g.83274  ORF Transcript_32890/g.83274 Transcript_32890/m.83274 type:complete len:294 (-) Transcript_32890:119-1000(-)
MALRASTPAGVGCSCSADVRRCLLLFVAIAAVPVRAAIHELYTTNSVCSTKYCINPIFPALAELPIQEAKTWSKQSLANVSTLMSFCGQMVDYDIAVSSETESSLLERSKTLEKRFAQGGVVTDAEAMASSSSIKNAVLTADRSAARQYFYHLQGMGIEAWDHVDPMQESSHPLRPCARTVAKLVCYTFFPMAPSSLADGQEVAYIKPCRTSCQNYLDTCGTTCCDEDQSCMWDSDSPVKTQDVSGGQVLVQTGYEGAGRLCTGSMAAPLPRSTAQLLLPLVALLGASAARPA